MAAGRRARAPSREKRPPSPSSAPAPPPAQEPPPPLLPGAEVEVRVDAAGFHGSWFEATVLHADPARGRHSGARYTVRYSHRAAHGGGGVLDESVAASHIRPRPPRPPSPSPSRFRLHDVVEAFRGGGWWSGVVFPSPAAAAKSVTVAFPITREVITFPPHYVRARRDFVGGEWVPSRDAIAVQPAREVRVYEAGDKVEAVRDREPYGRSWFPAMVAKAVDRLSYIVEYSDDEEEKAMEYLHWQYIRPAVDQLFPWEDKFQIEPGTKVEVYCDGAWSLGVVRRVVGEGEYEISLNGLDAEQVVAKVAELLRPLHEWDGCRWSNSSPEGQTQANLRQHSASGKRPSSPVEVSSSDDEHSPDPECSAIKKAKTESQLLQMVLAEGSEHALVSKLDSSLSALRKSPPISNHSLSSYSLLSGYSTPPNKSIPVGENQINQDTLPNTVLPRRKRGKINPTEEFNGNNDSPDNVSGQTNHGSSRKVVTQKRLLKKTGFKEPCSQISLLDGTVVQQEGMDLGLMLSFDSLLESIMKSCITDSEASFEERNSILSKAKANVEYVQSCHKRLSEAKSEYAKYLEEKDAIEAQKLEKRTSLHGLNLLLEKNDKAIAELEQKLGRLRQEGQQIEKDREHEQSELDRLEDVGSNIEEACNDAKRLFCSILAELQP